MGMEFGYNCKLYLPTLGKCRKLIENCRQRPELQKRRWLTAQSALVYLDATEDALIAAVDSGGIEMARRKKDGRMLFAVTVAGEYDDCLFNTLRWSLPLLCSA